MATSMCRFCVGRVSNFHTVARQSTRFVTPTTIATYSTDASPDDQLVLKVLEPAEEDKTIINKLRNVSGLKGNLYRRNHNKIPVIRNEYQQELRYQRRLYGKFGSSSKVDPRKCWPSRSELREEIEIEKEWEPTLQQMVDNIQKKRQAEREWMTKREETIAKNMEKMSGWIEEYRHKQQKVRDERRKQEEKKERLLEEAREYFGYKVDPRDAKFKEMMEQKAKEDKKLSKLKKKEDRDTRLKARLQALAEESQKS